METETFELRVLIDETIAFCTAKKTIYGKITEDNLDLYKIQIDIKTQSIAT